MRPAFNRLTQRLTQLNAGLALLLLAIALPASADSLGFGSTQPEFLPGDVAFQADAWREGDEIVAGWTALPGYYLYAQSFAVSIDGTPIDTLTLPEGDTRWDELFGEVQTHNDQVFARVAAPSNAQTVTLRHQGCAEAGLCYPPVTTVIHLNPAKEGAP